MSRRRHWILGNETHYGRGYFSFVRFDLKADALREAKEWGLTPTERAELSKHGRVELPGARARLVSFVAAELTACECQSPDSHDDL